MRYPAPPVSATSPTATTAASTTPTEISGRTLTRRWASGLVSTSGTSTRVFLPTDSPGRRGAPRDSPHGDTQGHRRGEHDAGALARRRVDPRGAADLGQPGDD